MRQHLVRDFVVGLAYLVLIAALIVVSVMVYNKDFTSSVDVTLSAGDVGPALQSGADVEVRGVVVGAVTSISSNGHGAQVHMSVDPGQAKNLPSNVTAEVLPKTLFGQRYVDLVIPATPSGTHLSNGDVIKPVSSAAPTQLQDVFAHLLPVLQAVRPAKLAETLGAIAASLRNKGAELGQTIDLLSAYLKKFAPKVPAMVRDIQQFSQGGQDLHRGRARPARRAEQLHHRQQDAGAAAWPVRRPAAHGDVSVERGSATSPRRTRRI